MAENGTYDLALELLKELLPEQEQALGKNNPETLVTRFSIAHYMAESGTTELALKLFRELLPDQERVLGKENAFTLGTMKQIELCQSKIARK